MQYVKTYVTLVIYNFFNLFVFNYNKYIAQNYIKRKRKAERDGIGILRMVEME